MNYSYFKSIYVFCAPNEWISVCCCCCLFISLFLCVFVVGMKWKNWPIVFMFINVYVFVVFILLLYGCIAHGTKYTAHTTHCMLADTMNCWMLNTFSMLIDELVGSKADILAERTHYFFPFNHWISFQIIFSAQTDVQMVARCWPHFLFRFCDSFGFRELIFIFNFNFRRFFFSKNLLTYKLDYPSVRFFFIID